MNTRIKPSDLMRKSKPYLFSDSGKRDAYDLSRDVLSHHLDSLTDRNQHTDFQNFCLKLCQREICPNLRFQTGPEGGGDGKVDTETYLVDEQVSMKWFIGNGNSGKERWAFAFSAKKIWSPKVRSDVKGIIETERNYEHIYFVTSRPTRSKDRNRIEDELEKEYGIPVTILDREWILDCVFDHDHKALVFEYLKAGEYNPEQVKLGPNDFERGQSLKEIEDRFNKLGNALHEQTQSVTDAYDAAALSRMLERPVYETEGRFLRAIKLAEKYGQNYQLLNAIYEHAWTRYWWFDDLSGMHELYDDVEQLAFNRNISDHISKVCNLHTLLISNVFNNNENPENYLLNQRTKRLKSKLLELVADNSRPNNSLYAKMLLLFHELKEKRFEAGDNNFDSIWNGLSDVIDSAAGLGEFPAEMLKSMIEALSEYTPDSTAFDILVEKLAEFMAERNKEVTAGNIYLTQGIHKLKNEKPIDAIKVLGRAVVNFSKEECREEQSKSLYYLAVAYNSAGLLWAGRSAALFAIVQFMALSEKDNKERIECIPAFILLANISLQIGHLADLLSAIQFLSAVRNTWPLSDEGFQNLDDELVRFDLLLAGLIARLDTREIIRLKSFPDIFEKLQMTSARVVLLYRLGHIDILKKDESIPEGMSDKDFQDRIDILAAETTSEFRPQKLVLFDENYESIRTKILGVEIEICSANTIQGFLHAETHIASLEGLVSTLLNARAYPCSEKLVVRVDFKEDILGADLSFQNYKNEETLLVSLPEDWKLTEFDNVTSINKHLIAFGVQTLANIAVLPNGLVAIDELVETERAFERATLISNSGVLRKRLFGSYTGQLSDWDYMIKRSYDPTRDIPKINLKEIPEVSSIEEIPEKIFDDLRRHDDLGVNSIINQRLWDQAEWKGMMYGHIDEDHPPFLGLIFRDRKAAEEIFKEWRKRFGEVDQNDEIRFSIIKGIDRNNPFHYRGCVTRELRNSNKGKNKRFVNVTRINTMTVNDHKNLDVFLKYFKHLGYFCLLPAIFDQTGNPELLFEYGLFKSKLYLRDAWQIGINDIDMVSIQSGDDIIIPENEDSPPVKELFEWRKKNKK